MSDERAVALSVAASLEADAAASKRLTSLVELLRHGAGERLCAVVLSGSLSRGEGVVVRTPAGLGLLSDIDLYAVLDPVDAHADAELAARARASLADDAFLLAPLDLGLVAADHFAQLGCTLPARQLGHGYRVLWEGTRGWVRPSATLGEGPVDPDDAAKLLHNRCAEQLLLDARDGPGLFSRFHRWKVWMDAPLAFLAAHDRYDANRTAQMEALALLVREWPSPARAWAEAGLVRLQSMRQAMNAPLTPSRLDELAGEDRELRAWVWPFHRALLRRGLGAPAAAASLQAAATAAGGPTRADARLQRRWLRRRGPWATMREARRWAPLAGVPVAPWWRHGWGGTGPDRVHLAAIDRFAQCGWWRQPLQGLIDPPDADETGLDAWLGGLWSSWIMGGARP